MPDEKQIRTCCLKHTIIDMGLIPDDSPLAVANEIEDILEEAVRAAFLFTLIVHGLQTNVAYKERMHVIVNNEINIYVNDHLPNDFFEGDYDKMDDFMRRVVLRVRDIIERDLNLRDSNFAIIRS